MKSDARAKINTGHMPCAYALLTLMNI